MGPKFCLERSLRWTQSLRFYLSSHVRVVLVVQRFLALLRGENFLDVQQASTTSNSSSLAFLASSLSCHNKELRNRDILRISSFIVYLSKICSTLAAFASLFSWRALYPCLSSKTCILNSFGLTQKDHKCTQGRPSLPSSSAPSSPTSSCSSP